MQTATERQIALEEEMIGKGVTKYHALCADKDEADLPPGQQIVRHNIKAVADALREFIADANSGKAGRKHSALRHLEAVEPEVAAYIGLRTALNCAAQQAPLQYTLILIGTTVEDHLNFKRLYKEAPGYFLKVTEDLNSRTANLKHRKNVLSNVMSKVNLDKLEWDTRVHLSLGQVILEAVENTTGLIERERTTRQKNDTPVLMKPTPKCEEWLRSGHASSELLCPVFLPMLVRPLPWTSPFTGGYLTTHMKAAAPARAVRGFNLMKTWNRSYLTELGNIHMPDVYDAVNSVQNVAWKINKPILNVLKEIWGTGGTLGGLPSSDDLPLPPRPHGIHEDAKMADLDEQQQAILQEWKAEAAHVYAENSRLASKRLAVGQKIEIAKRFMDEPELYFPHQLDWRGRIYPAPPFVNPQSDDSGKALLEFAEGKPLGDGGAFWLAVHLANLFGVDKVSFDDRVAWVMENEERILDSASDPLDGARFWTEADSPYCALAACFEWAGYRVMGDDYVSHLPIAMDGSCSGLQHFSAMLRDSIGGAAVNLVPSEKPADIYTQVAKVAQVKVDAMNDEEARLWHGGKVVRKISKQPCMTLCYGASLRGMQDQIKSALRKLDDEQSGSSFLDTDSNHAPSRFMGKIVRESIGEVVVAAKDAMDWLQEVARIAAGVGLPVRWTSPMGLVVQQEYKVPVAKRYEVFFNGDRVRVSLTDAGKKLDKKKQATGISPNFVHSLDSAHLMATVNVLVASGVTSLACVHDSFGTHAADVDVLHKAVRTAFVEQYREDVLQNFRDEIAAQLPPELAEEIPPLPPKGTLELASILEADYAFA